MPKVQANGIEIYYEIHGDGDPLVLIEGLGYASWMWYQQVDALSKHYKVIVYDNRGVGESDKPDLEYTISLFADDTAELLRALNIRKAHMLGVSMGGFIAQEFALKYPEMVDKLILCSTSFGGPNMIPIPPETLSVMMQSGNQDSSDEQMRKTIALAFNQETIPYQRQAIERILEEKKKHPQPKYAYQRQLFAGASFNAEERVSAIAAETLIIAGRGDRVVPYQNALLLYEKIPTSNVEIIEDAGHLFFIERPEIVNPRIIQFLKS